MRFGGGRSALTLLAAGSLVVAACGSDDGSDDAASSAPEDAPTVAVTTNILGDVVEAIAGDQFNVLTVMPVGADPHDFQASAQEVAAVLEADALIVNGEDFEEGLIDMIANAGDEGVPVHAAMETVATIEVGEGGHDDHEDDEDHDDETHEEDHDDETHEDHDDETHDEGHDDDDDHDHSGADPHFFTDPARMAVAVQGIGDFLAATLTDIDADALGEAVDAYVAQLEDLDAEVADLVDGIPESSRVLITNHEVFGYFADRYGFEVLGTVIPSGSTADGASAGEIAELAETIEDEGVPAIFTDAASPDALAATLADEVGDVAIVELFTESLGDADSEGSTYLDMVRTNAERIAEALS